MSKLVSGHGSVYLGGGPGEGVRIASRADWSLNLDREYVDAAAFGESKEYQTAYPGLRDIGGTFSGALVDWVGFTLTAKEWAQLFRIALRRKQQRSRYPSDGGRRR